MSFIFSFGWKFHNPNWRTHIFQRGIWVYRIPQTSDTYCIICTYSDIMEEDVHTDGISSCMHWYMYASMLGILLNFTLDSYKIEIELYMGITPICWDMGSLLLSHQRVWCLALPHFSIHLLPIPIPYTFYLAVCWALTLCLGYPFMRFSGSEGFR